VSLLCALQTDWRGWGQSFRFPFEQGGAIVAEKDAVDPTRGVGAGRILTLAAEHRRGLHLVHHPDCSACRRSRLAAFEVEPQEPTVEPTAEPAEA
jgi:hypothetical protein